MKPIKKTVTTIYTPEWVKQDFLAYGPDFRKAREGQRRKFKACFSCNHPFNDGEIMALASFGKHGNKVLCQKCASEMKDSDGVEV